MANQPDITLRNFPGEFASPNPAECPMGAAERLVNVALRQAGTLEADRGYKNFQLGAITNPSTAFVIDDHNFVFSAPTPGTFNPISVGNGTFTGCLSPNLLGSFSFASCVQPWGWDLGIQPLSGDFFSTGIASLQTGFIGTSRGLCKIENLAAVQTSNQPNLANTCLPPPVMGFQASAFTGNQACYFGNGAFTGASPFAWLPNNYSVAYRLVLVRKDSNGYFQFSEPSQRFVYTNTTGGNTSVSVLIVWPTCSPPDAFIQIYRSQSIPPSSAGVPNVPSDEMFLVTEILPSSIISPGATWYGYRFPGDNVVPGDDISPDSQIYVPLYTNRGLGNGIQASKANAPVSNVLFTFGNRSYFGDTNSQQAQLLLMAGTSAVAGPGLQAGDTATVDGQIYTGIVPGFPFTSGVTRTFEVYTAGTPSQNVANTARSLCVAINANYAASIAASFTLGIPTPFTRTDQLIEATYLSLGNGDEGQVYLRRPFPGAPAFVTKTSASRGWAQDYTQGVTSTSSPSPGGLYWSELNQPSSVPIANNVVLGSPGARVLAGVALRDYAIIYKEDGAWTVRETPRGPSFAPLDSTVHVEAPRTAVALQNTCLAFCSKGILSIGQYGTDNLSVPIQKEVLSYLNTANTTIFKNAFAIPYEAEAEYWLFLPPAGASACTTIKVYNMKTNSWRTASIAQHLCGVEGHLEQPTLRTTLSALMLGISSGWAAGSSPSAQGILVERKSLTADDMRWDDIVPPLSDVGNNNNGVYTVTTVPAWTGLIGRGDLLRVTQGGLTKTYVILSATLNAAQTLLTITFGVTFTGPIGSLASIVITPCVQSSIRFLPQTADAPLLTKEWDGTGCFIWHRYFNGSFFDVGWQTELSPLQSIAAEPGPPPVTWGFRPWNQTPWERQAEDWVVNTTLDDQSVRGAQLTHSLYYYNALSRFELSAVTYNIASISDRTVR